MHPISRVSQFRRRNALLASCAVGALAAMLPHSAAAQAFQGTGTVVAGGATITPGSGQTDVSVSTNQTVINWTPFDTNGAGLIDFLPTGSTAVFRGNTDDFTVLNRILPVDGSGAPTARPISLDGNVVSYVNDPLTFNRGNIWFYSPTGIIAGPNAHFEVGSLLMTTDDIQFIAADPGNNIIGSIYGGDGLVKFRGPVNSQGFVQIEPGAQINALGTNAYVALVAPRVVQGGTVKADGNIAYLAAEELDMTINAGLFDFTLLVGTDESNGNGIVHTGTTGGSASTNYYDAQTISMIALPKNTALTMLLSGDIGYDAAVNVYDDGSAIVLGSGVAVADPRYSTPDNQLGSIDIGDAHFRNRLTAYATDAISVAPDTTDVVFDGDTSLNALSRIDLIAETGETIIANQSLNLAAASPGAGGEISIKALDTGLIGITNTLSSDAGSYASFYDGTYLDGIGGDVQLLADGGTISASSIYLYSTGDGNYDPVSGGFGLGGNIEVAAQNSGTVTSSYYLYASANGQGGYSENDGGDGQGGSISILDNGGSLNFGPVRLSANSNGGYGSDSGGDSLGGSVLIDISGQSQSWQDLYVDVRTRSGASDTYYGGTAGGSYGSADAITLNVTGPGQLNLYYGLNFSAESQMNQDSCSCAFGRAGDINVNISSSGSLYTGDSIYLDASAYFGGEGFSYGGLTSPAQFGGNINFTVDGGYLDAAYFSAHADATGSSAQDSAETATGGSTTLTVSNGGSFYLYGSEGNAYLDLTADAYGYPGPASSDVVGGTAKVVLDDGMLTLYGDAHVSASAFGNSYYYYSFPSGDGFNATGGTAGIDLLTGTSGTASFYAYNVDVSAFGDARLQTYEPTSSGEAIDGNGGAGSGNYAFINVGAGSFTADSVRVDAQGYGGASGATFDLTPFQSGDGNGGTAQFSVGDSAYASAETLDVMATGYGGGEAVDAGGDETASLAGNGSGGTAQIIISNGGLYTSWLSIDATGYGADGMSSTVEGIATDGGFGQGGEALFTIAPGTTSTFSIPELTLAAEGYGGSGGYSEGGLAGNGGNGIGGSAIASIGDGGFDIGPFQALADGYAGDGGYGGETGAHGFGGTGYGGVAAFEVNDSQALSDATRYVSYISLFASGYGGYDPNDSVGASHGGQTRLIANVFDTDASIAVGGGVLALARGAFGLPGFGFVGQVSGAPLSIDGDVNIGVTRDATITADEELIADGNLSIGARSLTSTGQVSSYGTIGIETDTFLDAERLRSSGGPTLLADAGALTVSIDLDTGGNVIAFGDSVDIHSLGGLTFDYSQANLTDFSVATVDDLFIPIASAPGAISLSSSAGSVVSSSGLGAGTFTADGYAGVNLNSVSSDGDTTLLSASGDIYVGSLFAPTGQVTAIGKSVDLTSDTTISFAQLSATGGDIDLLSQDAVNIDLADATGNINITTLFNSLVSGGSITAGGAIDFDTGSGMALNAVTAVGTADLHSGNDGISINDLRSGLVTAYGPFINISSGSSLFVESATATSGDLYIAADGNLDVHYGSSSNDIRVRSFNGSFNSTGSLQATRDIAVIGASGARTFSPVAGRTAFFDGGFGTLDAVDVYAPFGIEAYGSNVHVSSTQNLPILNAQATSSLTLSADGGLLLFNGANAGTFLNLSSSGGAIQSFSPLTSGNQASVNAKGNIDLTALSSGGRANLVSSTGSINVDALTAGGPVYAVGTALDLDSPGALMLDYLSSSAGDINVHAVGDLTFVLGEGIDAMSAFGAATLVSSNGAISGPRGVNAGGNIVLDGLNGVALAKVDAGGTTLLHSGPSGTIDIDSLTSAGLITADGGDVFIDGPGGLAFDTATAAGAMTIFAVDDLSLASASAGGALKLESQNGELNVTGDVSGGSTNVFADTNIAIGGDLDAGGPLSVDVIGTFTVGGTATTGAADVYADGGIDLGALNASGTVNLHAAFGNVLVDALSAAGAVTAFGRDVSITGPAALTFADLDATAGNLFVQAGGNLSLATADATGTIFLGSTGGTLAASGSVNSGGAFSASSASDMAFGSLNSGGTTALGSSAGAITVTGLVSSSAVTATGGGIDLTASGPLSITNAHATAGGVRIVTSGNLAVAQATASGALALSSSNGALTASGPVTAGGNVNLFGNAGATFGTLVSGGTTLVNGGTGALSVTSLTSSGLVTALGQTVDIASPGALSFSSAAANGGLLKIATAGNLSLPSATASGALSVASSTGSVTSTGTLTAGGAVAITGPAGIDLAALNSGGIALLQASNGAVAVDALSSAGAVTALGRSIDIAATGNLAFADIDATAGDASVVTGGNLALATVDATGALVLRSSGGTVTATNTLNAGGNATVQGNSVSLAALNSGGTTQVLGASGGTVTVSALISAGAVSATGGSIAVTGRGPLTFGALNAANDLAVTSTGNLTFTSVSAGAALALNATGGSITVGGNLSGAATTLLASGNIAVAGTLTAGPLTVTSGGTFAVSGVATAGAATIVAQNGITLGTLTSGTTLLQADNGTVSVGNLLASGNVTARGRALTIASTGGLTFAQANATAGNAAITADSFLTLQSLSASGLADLRTNGVLHAAGTITGGTVALRSGANLDADANLVSAGALSIIAGGTFTLAGSARGASVNVASSNIALGSSASLGQRGLTTTLSVLNSNPLNPTNLGGASQGGYSLDQAEMARLFADQRITLGVLPLTTAPPGSGAINVGDFAMTFSGTGNIAPGGTLKIDGPSTITINGKIALTTSSAADTFDVDPALLQLNTTTGSIAMLGSNGSPLGSLGLTANTIAFASASVLSQLQGMTDIAAINQLLGTPGGGPEPLRVGSVSFNVIDGLYIQNTGTTANVDDRRGFTAGTVAVSTGSAATKIVISGQLLGTNGPVTGANVVPLVTINGAPAAAGGQFAVGSTINSCALGASCTVQPPPPPPEMQEAPDVPTSEDLQSPLTGETTDSLFLAPVIQLADTLPLITPPLVDEPITGVGNDDLWQPPCDDPEGACSEGDGAE